MLRIGFAGGGFIAGLHAELLAAMPDVSIAAVFDADRARAEAFAGTHGGRALPSFEEMLGECEALYICTPNALHAAQAIAALEAGKHVFSEKPMATSVDDARRVRDASAKAKGVYQLGFNKRFARIYVELKRRIEAGALQPRSALLKMNRGELQKPPWVADASLTGGFLYETPIHILDLACWLFGPPRQVSCRASDDRSDFAATLTFASGTIASFISSARTTWLYPYERVEVYGQHAIAVTEEMERITFQLALDQAPETFDATGLPQAERWGYRAEDEAFLAAVCGEPQLGAGVTEGLLAVELVDALYRSADSGQPVVI